ncbi:hypothetical protein JX265_000818 [Neoarthrinium moseri]|uniref:Uncharacterized protein n=1 Tax=Neoarthrinium moseri TaxID=1658444 RepID=A0A9P9WWH8_9PEZI|nr:hypothetical protein JX265_000818 [Neoarthrinium moseri]
MSTISKVKLERATTWLSKSLGRLAEVPDRSAEASNLLEEVSGIRSVLCEFTQLLVIEPDLRIEPALSGEITSRQLDQICISLDLLASMLQVPSNIDSLELWVSDFADTHRFLPPPEDHSTPDERDALERDFKVLRRIALRLNRHDFSKLIKSSWSEQADILKLVHSQIRGARLSLMIIIQHLITSRIRIWMQDYGSYSIESGLTPENLRSLTANGTSTPAAMMLPTATQEVDTGLQDRLSTILNNLSDQTLKAGDLNTRVSLSRSAVYRTSYLALANLIETGKEPNEEHECTSHIEGTPIFRSPAWLAPFIGRFVLRKLHKRGSSCAEHQYPSWMSHTGWRAIFSVEHHCGGASLKRGDECQVMESVRDGDIQATDIGAAGSFLISLASYALSFSRPEIARLLLHNVLLSESCLSWSARVYIERELMREFANEWSPSSLPSWLIDVGMETSSIPANRVLQAVLKREYSFFDHDVDTHLDILDGRGYSPLHLAVVLNDVKMVEILCHKGAAVQFPDTMMRKTPLHSICEMSTFDQRIGVLLYDHGAEIDFQDAMGRTPLHYAVIRCLPEAVKFLLSLGADPNIRDFARGDTVLNMIPSIVPTDDSHRGILKDLILAGADLNLADDSGSTPLMNAIKNPDTRIFIDLHQAGASCNNLDAEGKSVLHYAAIWASSELISYMTRACSVKVNPELADKRGKLPMDYMRMATSMERPWCCGAINRTEEDCALFNSFFSGIDTSDHRLYSCSKFDETVAHNESASFVSQSKADVSVFATTLPRWPLAEYATISEDPKQKVSGLESFDTSTSQTYHLTDIRQKPPSDLTSTSTSSEVEQEDQVSSAASDNVFTTAEGADISTAASSIVAALPPHSLQSALKGLATIISQHVETSKVLRLAAEDDTITFRRYNRALKLCFRRFALDFGAEARDHPNAVLFLQRYADVVATATVEMMSIPFASKETRKWSMKVNRSEYWEGFLEDEFIQNGQDLHKLTHGQQTFMFQDLEEHNLPRFGDLILQTKVMGSNALACLPRNIRDLIDPPFVLLASKLVDQALQQRIQQETGFDDYKVELLSIVAELAHSRPSHLGVETGGQNSWANSAKLGVERVTGESWNWWPLSRPDKPLRAGEAQIIWTCNCGDYRSANVPRRLAQNLKRVVENYFPNQSQPSGSELAGEVLQLAALPPVEESSTQARPSNSSPTGDPAQTNAHAAPPEHIQSNQSEGKYGEEDKTRPRYIFLMVNSGRFHLGQLQANKFDTGTFAKELRAEYKKLRGFWRQWLSISTFSHCDFVKFEKFCPSQYAHRGTGLPDRDPHAKDYYYHPRPPQCSNPPISPEEFRHIFYFYARSGIVLEAGTQIMPLAAVAQGPSYRLRIFWGKLPALFAKLRDGKLPSDTVPKIPQRFRYFEEQHTNREELWGLYAREERSALMVLIYVLVFLMPWFAFCFIYIFGLDGERPGLQDATTPLTISLTSVSLFLAWLLK